MRRVLLLSLTVLLGLAFGTWFQCRIDPSNRWLWKIFQLKREAMGATVGGGGRIVVIGDSNALFGIDADLLAAETGHPAVNFGLVASLGATGHLGAVDASLQRGDVLVLSFLPDAFTQAPEVTPNAWMLGWEMGDPRAATGGAFGLVESTPTEWLSGALSVTTPGLRRIVNYYARLALRQKLFRYEDLTFDKTGTLLDRVNLPHVMADAIQPYAPVWDPLLVRIVERARARGITVVYAMPWIQTSPEKLDPLREQSRKFLADLGGRLPALTDESFGVQDDPALFSDFLAHLSVEGAKQRTHQLAERLKEGGFLPPLP